MGYGLIFFSLNLIQKRWTITTTGEIYWMLVRTVALRLAWANPECDKTESQFIRMSYGLIFFYRYFHFSNLLHIRDCQFSWYYENISIISKDIYLCKCQDNFQIIARYLWHWIWMVHYGPTIVFGHLVSHLGESDRSDALSGVHILKILMSWKECYSLIFLNFTPRGCWTHYKLAL